MIIPTRGLRINNGMSVGTRSVGVYMSIKGEALALVLRKVLVVSGLSRGGGLSDTGWGAERSSDKSSAGVSIGDAGEEAFE
jgi:hypothetical protein